MQLAQYYLYIINYEYNIKIFDFLSRKQFISWERKTPIPLG